MKNYVRPTVEVENYQYEGVLCSSVAATTENYNIHEETDW